MENPKTKLTSMSELNQLKLTLPPKMGAPKKVRGPNKKPRVHLTTEPVYIRKLVDKLGKRTKAAPLIGCTDGLIARALKENSVTLAYELAAMGVWERDFEPKPSPIKLADLVVVTVALPKAAWDVVKPWLDDAGAVSSELHV